MYDIEQIKVIYEDLTYKVKEELNEQFEKGRLKGTDYANVYAQLMDRCLQLAFQSPLNEVQQNKINTDIEISQTQSEKDLLLKQAQIDKLYSDKLINELQSEKDLTLKEKEIALKESQKNKIDSDRNIAEEQSEKDLTLKEKESILKDKQTELYERQKQGFDDNLKQKLLEVQLNAWSMMFSSGMLEAKPHIIESDAVSTVYNNIAQSVGIPTN